MVTHGYSEKFEFAVEGDTEQYYLEWLAQQINNDQNATHRCFIPTPKKGKDPEVVRRKFKPSFGSKRYYYLADKERYHDRESFRVFIKKLKPRPIYEKSIKFKLGYCNVSFELWILLHKTNFSTPVQTPDEYLPHINKAFGTDFPDLRRYKEKEGFKKILKKLTMDDVKNAINRAKNIQKQLATIAEKQTYCGYEYFDENPSLSIHEVIEEILTTCEVPL